MPTCKWNPAFQHLASPQPWITALQSSPLRWCCQSDTDLLFAWSGCLSQPGASRSSQGKLLLWRGAPLLPPWQEHCLDIAPKSKAHILVCDPKGLLVNQELPLVSEAHTWLLGSLFPWDWDLDMGALFSAGTKSLWHWAGGVSFSV